MPRSTWIGGVLLGAAFLFLAVGTIKVAHPAGNNLIGVSLALWGVFLALVGAIFIMEGITRRVLCRITQIIAMFTSDVAVRHDDEADEATDGVTYLHRRRRSS